MDLSLFWKKKTVLSYVLAILVFVIHVSSLCNYTAVLGNDNFMAPWIWFKLVVCRCAVPTFFILSGAIFFRDYDNGKYVEKLRSRVTTLLVPYLAWNTIWMIFGVVTTLYFSEFFIGRDPSVITPGGILLSILHWRDNGPFWFVFNLIVFIIASPIVYYALRNKYCGLIVISVIAILTQMGYGIPQQVFYMSESIIYYLVGAFIGIHCFDWFTTRSKKKTIISLAIVFLCIMLRSLFPADTANLFIWNNSGFYGSLLLMVYGIAVIFAFDVFSYSKNIPRIFSHSFWVYAMHLNVSAVVCKLLFFLLPKTLFGAWINFFATIILTILIIECVVFVLQRYAHPIYAILSGDRK